MYFKSNFLFTIIHHFFQYLFYLIINGLITIEFSINFVINSFILKLFILLSICLL